MKRRNVILLIMTALIVLVLSSCSSEPGKTGNVSISFSGISRSVVAVPEGFDKDSYYWKYAARMVLTESEQNGGQTQSYDEEGAVFIHETVPGPQGTIGGFSEGTWDFLLFGYKRTGEEGSYTYNLVYSGETTGVQLVNDSENMVDVQVSPVTDHGNGVLFIDAANISFAPAGEIDEGSALEMSFTVRSVPGDEEQIGEGGIYSLVPGLYRVDVKYTVDEYTYAHGAVIATVYSNQTTMVSGTVNELKTYANIDIPDEG